MQEILVFNPHLEIDEEDYIIYKCSQKINGIPMIHRELDPETQVAMSRLMYTPDSTVYSYIRRKLSQMAIENDGELLRKAFENSEQPLCANCMNCPLEYAKLFHTAITG